MTWTPDVFWSSPESPAEESAPDEFVREFAASMPSRYAVLFDPHAVRRHAGVSFRRGERPAAAEVWRRLPDRSAALCIVANDRPGLLSAIAAALVSHRLDVITALVFSRVRDAGAEAVDLLWVRRASPGDVADIDSDEAVSIGEVLNAILLGRISVEEIATRAQASQEARRESEVVVAFRGTDEDGHAVLVVEAPDRPGILLTITFELFQQGAQIVRSLVRTSDGRAYNSFELAEFSGASLSPARREQLQAAVHKALALGEK